MEEPALPREMPALPSLEEPYWISERAEPIPFGSREAPILLVPDGAALAIAWLCLSGGLSGIMCLALVALPPDYDGFPAPPHWVEWLRVAGYAWIALACTGLMLAHFRRGARVWAALFAFLFAQCAALAASCVLNGLTVVMTRNGISDYLSGPGIGFAALAVLRPVAAFAVTFLFFRVRAWYGVPLRRGWRTMWFSGGWMLVLTALIFGANQVAQYRYFR